MNWRNMTAHVVAFVTRITEQHGILQNNYNVVIVYKKYTEYFEGWTQKKSTSSPRSKQMVHVLQSVHCQGPLRALLASSSEYLMHDGWAKINNSIYITLHTIKRERNKNLPLLRQSLQTKNASGLPRGFSSGPNTQYIHSLLRLRFTPVLDAFGLCFISFSKEWKSKSVPDLELR